MIISFTKSQVRGPICLIATIAALLCGCSGGDKQAPVFAVSGTVTYNSQPLDGATVVFLPKSSDADVKPATAVTDSQGAFQLSAAAGEHTVTVTKFASAGGGGAEESMEVAAEKEGSATPDAKSEIPEKYSNPETSGIQETVAESGDNEFKIELTD